MKFFSLISSAAAFTMLSASGFSEDQMDSLPEIQSSSVISYSNDGPSSQKVDDHERRIQNLEYQNSTNNGKPHAPMHSPKVVADSAHGCMSGFSIGAEFLWWRAQLDGLEYMVFNSVELGVTPPIGSGPIREPSFEFDPGVRVSAGYDFGCENWDIFFRWTYHHTDPTNSFNRNGTGALIATKDFQAPQGAIALTFADTAHAKWTNRLNVIDFEMGYDYFLSCRFSLRPYMGVKAAWIHSDFDVRYGNSIVVVPAQGGFINVGTVNVRSHSDYWGAGPQVGIDGYLHIGWGFSLYSNFSTAFIYGQYDSTLHETDETGLNMKAHMNDYSRQRAVGQLALGAEWAKCFSGDYMLSFHIGWEGQYWWNQNEFRYYEDQVYPKGDLTYTGLDVGARFDF